MRGNDSGFSMLCFVLLLVNSVLAFSSGLDGLSRGGRTDGLLWSHAPSNVNGEEQLRNEHPLSTTRRLWLSSVIMSSSGPLTAFPSPAAARVEAAMPAPAPIQGIGGGADIRTPLSSASADVTYPISMEGLWQCQRVVALVEGNADQALVAWKALRGGSDDDSIFTKQKIESYLTRYIALRNGDFTVLNRGLELESRSSVTNVQWEADAPNVLTYKDPNGIPTELAVVQRQVEPPSDQGFGFNELVRITTSTTLFGDAQRCVQVKRRYRRAFDDNQGAEGGQKIRVVEGLEIVKTFRVLDGIAGVEMPTSTTKSQIRMVRPTATQSTQ